VGRAFRHCYWSALVSFSYCFLRVSYAAVAAELALLRRATSEIVGALRSVEAHREADQEDLGGRAGRLCHRDA
jgi:hypothetical protein